MLSMPMWSAASILANNITSLIQILVNIENYFLSESMYGGLEPSPTSCLNAWTVSGHCTNDLILSCLYFKRREWPTSWLGWEGLVHAVVMSRVSHSIKWLHQCKSEILRIRCLTLVRSWHRVSYPMLKTKEIAPLDGQDMTYNSFNCIQWLKPQLMICHSCEWSYAWYASLEVR